jgi:hypothetical protein
MIAPPVELVLRTWRRAPPLADPAIDVAFGRGAAVVAAVVEGVASREVTASIAAVTSSVCRTRNNIGAPLSKKNDEWMLEIYDT